MKILLYFENENLIKKSGIGRALEHQKKALELNGIEYTTNPKDKFDIAHINTIYLKSNHLIKKCKKRGIPVVVHGHSTEEDFCNSFKAWKLMRPFFYQFLKNCYSKPDLIITPTEYSKGLIENYSYVKCPVVAISNGIDLVKYSNYKLTNEDILEIKTKFNIKEKERVVMGIGWFFERKGFHDFVEVASKMLDVKFIWFGNLNKASNTKKINQAIKNKTDNVILPGYVPQGMIIKMLHFSDLFFFPSYEETEGIVLLEALASRLPVLVRDIGAFSYLRDGVDCFKGNNNEEFIEKINYVFNNDVKDIVSNGFEIAEARNLDKIGKLLKENYEKLLKK